MTKADSGLATSSTSLRECASFLGSRSGDFTEQLLRPPDLMSELGSFNALFEEWLKGVEMQGDTKLQKRRINGMTAHLGNADNITGMANEVAQLVLEAARNPSQTKRRCV